MLKRCKGKIKAIAIDMDGTWLDGNCRISEENFRAVQRALDAGYLVIPATGRSYRNAEAVLGAYRGLRYFLNANGTTVTDRETGRLLYAHAMPYTQAKALFAVTRTLPCFVEVYEGTEAYVDREGVNRLYQSGMSKDYCDQLLSTNRYVDSLEEFMANPDRRVCKFHVVCENVPARRKLMERMARVENSFPVSTFDRNAEAVCGRWSKACGLQHTAGLLGLAREEIMAIGDSDNDYDMLVWAGFSVAMGNGNARVKSAADFISRTNDQDGVAYALSECLGI